MTPRKTTETLPPAAIDAAEPEPAPEPEQELLPTEPASESQTRARMLTMGQTPKKES